MGLLHCEFLGRRQHHASRGHRRGPEVAQWAKQGALLLGSPTMFCILKQPGLLQRGGGVPSPRQDHEARPEPCQQALETELAAPQELHVTERNGLCDLDSPIDRPRALGGIPGFRHGGQAPYPLLLAVLGEQFRHESPKSM